MVMHMNNTLAGLLLSVPHSRHHVLESSFCFVPWNYTCGSLHEEALAEVSECHHLQCMAMGGDGQWHP